MVVTMSLYADQKETSDLLKVGELARLSAKTVRALHLYEEMGLLHPLYRTKGGFRLYSKAAVERVQWITRLQEADLSLSEIKAFLEQIYQKQIAKEAMDRARQMFSEKLKQIQKQQAQLKALELDLKDGLAYLEACQICEPSHVRKECISCTHHGHNEHKPIMVAGLHHEESGRG